jgi:hypothetical protein
VSATYTLTVDGITSPTIHHALAAAIAELEQLLAALPVDDPGKRAGNRRLLADLELVRQLILRDGEVRIDLVAAGRSYEAVISSSSAPSCNPRSACPTRT